MEVYQSGSVVSFTYGLGGFLIGVLWENGNRAIIIHFELLNATQQGHGCRKSFYWSMMKGVHDQQPDLGLPIIAGGYLMIHNPFRLTTHHGCPK